MRFLILTIALCLLSTFILLIFKSKPNALSFIKGFFAYHFVSGNDSWKAMIGAIELIKKAPDKQVYDALFGSGIKFQYPLSSLLLFDGAKTITGASYVNIAYWLDRISAVCVFLFSFFSAKILICTLKVQGIARMTVNSKTEVRLIYFLVLVLTFLFYPILRSYGLGQIQTIITLLTAIAIYCWQHNKKAFTGIIFGFICLIKPQLGLLFLWGAIRKQWKMVIPGLSIVAIFSLISAYLYGFNNNLYYLKVLSFLSQRGESFFANQSVNGLLNRVIFNGNNLEWDGKFPDFNPLVYYGTLTTSLILMIGGLLWRLKNDYPSVIELSIMILCTTMASPIAWEHHYAIVFTIFLLMIPYMHTFYKDKVWTLLLFVIGYVLVSQYYQFVNTFADTRWNILQSHLFIGACILLFFLFRVSWKFKKQE